MNGIKFYEENGCHLCYIEELSSDLKNAISCELSSICYGASYAQNNKQMCIYANTLKNFLTRYDNKTENQRKGIIGELLAHLLVNRRIHGILAASILFNKEEKSMRKGFDIVLFNPKENELWYSEVKSGEKTGENSSKSNNKLLVAAKTDIRKKFNSRDDTIWNNALIDANLTVNTDIVKNLSILLQNDAPCVRGDQLLNGNVVLVSVLYESLIDKIDHSSMLVFCSNLVKEKVFQKVIVFSIQKETYKKIEEFLRSENERLASAS